MPWPGLLINPIRHQVVGVFLFAAGLVIFLLPFTIAASAPKGWATGYIIAMIVVGLFLIAAFATWEIWVAPVPFLQAKYLTNRTLLAVCLINATYQMAYYCWNSYFISFLQVVNGVSVAEAGYINNTFQVVSGVELFIVGYFIRRTGSYLPPIRRRIDINVHRCKQENSSGPSIPPSPFTSSHRAS